MRILTFTLTLALVALPLDRAGSSSGGAVAGRVASGGKGRANVVVYLTGVPGPPPDPARLPKRQIRQRDTAFDPAVSVVVVGSTVEFPNEDKIYHNVFSLSEPARFDLGLYKSGTSKAVTFKRAGVVDVYCNIHPQMVSKIKVLENQHYAITQGDGSFRIDDVPPGTYPLVAWQPFGDEYRGEVTIAPGGVARVEIALAEGRASRTHLRKDGTPYGRYK
jgi:plastocyanin